MTKTIEARCADHIAEPFVRRCTACDEEQRELDVERQTMRVEVPDLQMRGPDEIREMRVSDVLRALRNERRDGFVPEFTASDWEAAARHLLYKLGQSPINEGETP